MKSKAPLKKATEDLIKSPNLFPVVGIGASAGGLDAFKRLLKAIPQDSGMAYVLVQHLDPNHESLLPSLLQKVTSIPVLEVSDDIKVEPDHIYVIPSNRMMVANDGVLSLTTRPETDKFIRHLPIDLFFASLAEVHQAHAIGVVLSGTANDGTQGLKAIKGNGGITFAQDEESAAYEGMPHSAVQAGVVDFVLPPEEIPKKILEVTAIFKANRGDDLQLPKEEEDVYKQIIALLRVRKGTDFTYYKQATIRRRILRRMALNKNDDSQVYLKFLRENKSEQDVLYQDLLIPVSDFFRDTRTFDNLHESVFPNILKNKTAGESIRVWVAGCSTGEEAYSLAICFKEFLGDSGQRIQIFATDISEPAIAKARRGIYTKSEVESVSQLRLNEFFVKNNGHYQVKRYIRDMCVFATHSFVKDPPFGKMDFVSCRNVLIYMEPYLQKKALTTFHYALNPKGFLLLGKSETTSGVPDLFASAVKTDKLFTRKDVPGRFMHVVSQQSERNLSPAEVEPKSEIIRTDFQKTADDILLTKYTPAGVVINEAMDIVHFRGNTSNYLQQTSGKPSHNLMKMAKDGLSFELRNILHKAKKEKTTVTKENVPLKINNSMGYISIEAIPLPNTIEPHYLILFQETRPLNLQPSQSKVSSKVKKDEKDLRIKQLESELAQTREDMHSITEDQEAANEELQSANEELLSGNEELQSLNEEMETNKEELQSTNEELTVVNHEIISLNEQITEARDFAEAIVVNIREPLLVLDKSLRIKTANDAFYKTFRLNELETEGVLIYNLGNKQWDIPALRTLLEKTIPEKSSMSDFEVRQTFSSIGERVMMLNAREIVSKSNSEKLILLSIEDVTERKRAAQYGSRLTTIVDSSEDAIISKNLDGTIVTWNKGAEKIFGYNYKEAVGKHISILIPPDLRHEEEMIIGKIKKGESVQHYDTLRMTKDGKKLNVSVTVSPIKDIDGTVTGASKIARNITEQVLSRKIVEENEAKFRSLIEEAPVATCLFTGREMKIEVANDIMIGYWGKGKNVIGKKLADAVPELKEQPFLQILDNVFTSGQTYHASGDRAELTINGVLGTYYFDYTYKPLFNASGEVYGILDMAVDVTEQVIARKKVEESEKKFKQLAELMPQKVWTADAEGGKTYFNQTLLDYVGLPEEELKGDGWEKVIHPDDWEADEKRWDESTRTGKKYKSESRFLRKDGEYLWHLNMAVPLKDEQGQIIQWIGTKTEIQEERNQKKGLEDAVEERTSELEQANEDLLKMNKELEAFAYVSSHDLQEPLRKIQTFATRILEKEVDNLSVDGKGYFQRMQSAAARMQQLIEDLLAFSRINTTDRVFETTDLNILLEEVKADIKDAIDAKHATIESNDLCPANIIPFQFRQLMHNLIGNALKFSKPNQPPHIVIKSRIVEGSITENKKLSPDKKYCHISVADNGIGFEPEFKVKIFEVFQRLHGKGEFAGTGIGLAIVKKIVDNHHGFITATGELNKGATFDIYIPAD